MKRNLLLPLFLAGSLTISFSSLTGCAAQKPVAYNVSEEYYAVADLSSLEKEMFDAINTYRASRKLPAFEWNDNLNRLARDHSLDMANGSVPFGHYGVKQRSAAIDQTFKWNAISENVAYSSNRDALINVVLNNWLKSPGHYRNIIGNYNISGIGAERSPDGKVYFTQMFVDASGTRK